MKKLAQTDRLLLDRRLIEHTTGVRLHIAQGRRHAANPLTLDGAQIWTPGNLHFICNRDPQEGTYWGWYCERVGDPAAREANPDDWHAQLTPVRSPDGLTWQRAGTPLSPGKERTILHDPHESNADRRFKSVYQRLMQRDVQGNLVAVSHTEMRRRERAGERGTRQMVSAWSPDGTDWSEPHVVVTSTQHPEHRWWRVGEPGWDGSDNFPSLVWAPERQVYVAYFRTNLYNGPGQRRERGIGRAESVDFERWSEHQLALHAGVPHHSALGYPTHDIYQMQVWRHGGVYLGFVSVFDWAEDRIHLELAWSPDTIHWERICPGTDLVPMSAFGEYDGGCCYAASMPTVDGDEVRLYYGGASGKHNATPNRQSTLCLALFQRDRFAGYATNGSEPGVILTRPFELASGRLAINVDASGGEMRAELCDAGGAPLPGHTRADAVPVNRDLLNAPLTWAGGSEPLQATWDRLVRLRLYVNHATAYALYAGGTTAA